jgi:hypothetical protein
VGSRAEICLSIVQAVAIDMVNKHIVRDFEYRAVHRKVSVSYTIDGGPSTCVKCFAVGIGVPFVSGEMPVIIWVYECIFTSRQPNSAEGIAVANPPIEKHQPNKRCQKPSWYLESNSDGLPPTMMNRAKSKILIRISNLLTLCRPTNGPSIMGWICAFGAKILVFSWIEICVSIRLQRSKKFFENLDFCF